ncbi:MAG: hypothetical protein AAB725_01630 [Patescibacteria group bacterium]
MIVTIRELVRVNDTNLMGVTSGGGHLMSLTDEECATLGYFQGIALEIDVQSLPLQVYLISGSMKRLAIYPRKGYIKFPVARSISLKDEENVRELVIYREPKE